MHSFSALAQQFEQRFQQDMPFPTAPDSLYDPCRYLLQYGGKRIRPVLCLMANELFTEIVEDAWQAAFGIELFHNFTLIHDDIMDKAPLRRGQATIHTKYGLTSGILSGDVMCIFAYKHFASIQNALPAILDTFNTTAIQVCEGQQLDMDFETRNDITIPDYIHMITLKTSVLLACSLKIGALVGGALGDTANNLYEFGKNMGIAFQLQDDYLDTFGDEALLGKQIGGDIKANKKTFLLIKALENSTETQRRTIEAVLNVSSADKIASMTALFEKTGAKVACSDMALDYASKSFEYLEKAAIPSSRKQPLFDLANYLLTRDK